MLGQDLSTMLEHGGYEKMPSNLPEFTVYFQLENNHVNAIHVIDYNDKIYISEDQYSLIKEKIGKLFTDKGIREVHILSIILCNDMDKARRLCGNDWFCWFIDTLHSKLMVYENQISDFYGLRNLVEHFLEAGPKYKEEKVRAIIDESERQKKAYVTYCLTGVNVLLFLICTFTGNLLYNIGGLSAAHIKESSEYYRILTSIFLHFDINHLLSNMLILFFLGETIERYYGHVKYGILYFAAGICGNVVSLMYDSAMNLNTLSVGASGALFGVIAALLVLVLIHKGRFGSVTLGRILFMVVYSIYSGFLADNINNAAHLGGFFAGGLVAFLFGIQIYKRKSGTKESCGMGAEK